MKAAVFVVGLVGVLAFGLLTARAVSQDIVDTAVSAGSFKTLATKAVSGDTITVTTRDGKVQVDKANVVNTDIAASNGVIHVIDAVILPAGK